MPTYAHGLKQWILGGKLLTIHALFDEGDYKKSVIGDLFSEERYFSDAKLFWELQNKAISARRYAYDKEGWAAVHILEVGERWLSWEHVLVQQSKGGHVYIETSHDGEVKFHEGYLTQKEYERRRNAEGRDNGGEAPKVAKPELTQAMENYLGLHRHAAVQAELLNHPSIALRLTVAHMVADSGLWSVKADSQKGNSTAITESIAGAKAVAEEDEDEAEGYSYSGYGRDSGRLVRTSCDYGQSRDLDAILETLLGMDDSAVMRVMTLTMAETLCAHTPMVNRLADLFQTDMRNWWKPEPVFFDLLRDKDAINAMVREVAGCP